jgi:hypothetical protein
VSRSFFVGALLASSVWAGAWFFLHREATAGADAPSADPCAGRCGEGTVCEAERCELAQPDPEPTADTRRSKRRGKRKAGGGAADPSDQGPADPSDQGPAQDAAPPIIDDRSIPAYSEAASKTLDMNAGSERLSAEVLDAQLRRLTPRFQGCVRDAIARGAALGSGTITIKATIAGSGRVEGVSASAPASLGAPGVIPCVRKAVHDHRFPAFDGPSMNATFRFEVD